MDFALLELIEYKLLLQSVDGMLYKIYHFINITDNLFCPLLVCRKHHN